MGITIVQKSDLSQSKVGAKTALVLSGGAISGGAFKLGGLQALSSFMLNRKIREFDIYVGVSVGALIATFLANGVSTGELSKSMDGRKGQIDPIALSAIYFPNYMEMLCNPLRSIGNAAAFIPRYLFHFLAANNVFREEFRRLAGDFILHPSQENFRRFFRYCLLKTESGSQKLFLRWKFLPNGIFSTEKFEQAIRKNLERNHLCNDFETLYTQRKNELYIVATNLNTAQREIFGHGHKQHVPISKAMEASIALPLFYKPVEIDNIDYVDGAVVKTTSIDLAIQKGAELIICYNPFRPFNHQVYCERCEEGQSHLDIADDGIYAVFNQVLRTLLHSRLMHGINSYRSNPDFKGDLIVIEPTEYDAEFFDMNPMAFWERRKAAKRGFLSVKASIHDRYPELRRILGAYGIQVNEEFARSDSAASELKTLPMACPGPVA